jgi:hypothetical protein
VHSNASANIGNASRFLFSRSLFLGDLKRGTKRSSSMLEAKCKANQLRFPTAWLANTSGPSSDAQLESHSRFVSFVYLLRNLTRLEIDNGRDFSIARGKSFAFVNGSEIASGRFFVFSLSVFTPPTIAIHMAESAQLCAPKAIKATNPR